MRLLAITHPHCFDGEAAAIHDLIRRGWWRVHIRKPQASAAQIETLLSALHPSILPHISLHDHMGLAVKWHLGGVHLNARNPQAPQGWQGMVSRSCHSIAELSQYRHLDYLTLSPIFDSISKRGYVSQFTPRQLHDADLQRVVALGGVTFGRLNELAGMGFEGAAMLTEPWKTTDIMLQFITHTNSGLREALGGGCRWVQLRMKEATDDEFAAMARKVVPLCREYGAKIIFDDRVHLVAPLGADGVHLGKLDMPLPEARRLLGPEKIIGATANTLADVEQAAEAGADYIGVGPYRFTTTKRNLSPILGLEGYRDILSQARKRGIVTPIVAIGGITVDDLPALKETGVDGVAVSGLILNSEDIRHTTQTIIQTWTNS